jgi:type I site-specific restriction endonuclease
MNQNDETLTREIFGGLIYSYSRADALRDGVLVDVSERAKRAGIKYPTACTAGVWALIDCLPESDTDTLAGIVRDVRAEEVLRVMLAAIRQAHGTDRVAFEALGAALWAQCGPGDTAAPVITIMLEGED